MSNDQQELIEVNQAFYSAFASGNFSDLSEVWAKKYPISVIHPGGGSFNGYEAVMDSWKSILENASVNDIVCINPDVHIIGDCAYILCHERISGVQLIATNVFVREENTWRMVHHHAAPDKNMQKVHSDITKSIH